VLPKPVVDEAEHQVYPGFLHEAAFAWEEKVRQARTALFWAQELDNVDSACAMGSTLALLLVTGAAGFGIFILALRGCEELYAAMEDCNEDLDIAMYLLIAAIFILGFIIGAVVFFCLFAASACLCLPLVVHKFSRYRMTRISGQKDLLLVPLGTNFYLSPGDCRRVARQLAKGMTLQRLTISLETDPGSLDCIFDTVADVERFGLALCRPLTEGEVAALVRMLHRCSSLRWVHMKDNTWGEEGSFVRGVVAGLGGAERLQWILLDGAVWGELLPSIGNELAQLRELEEVDLLQLNARVEDVENVVDELLHGCPRMLRLNVDGCKAVTEPGADVV